MWLSSIAWCILDSHRYRVTDTRMHHAILLSHIHTRLLQPGLAD